MSGSSKEDHRRSQAKYDNVGDKLREHDPSFSNDARTRQKDQGNAGDDCNRNIGLKLDPDETV